MKPCHHAAAALLAAMVLSAGGAAVAQTNRPIYTDNCVNNFSTAGHNAIVNVGNTALVHGGGYSISVDITGSGGYLAFNHSGFNSSPYGNVSFWLNGGSAGGENLKVYGTLNGAVQSTSYALTKLMTNVWQQFTVPLAFLGCANASNFTGFLIEDALGAAQPVFYVDDVFLGASPAPLVTHLNILASQTNRLADARWFGVNTATWDSYLGNAVTLPALTNAGITTVRWPGGSESDDFNWTTDDGGLAEQNTFNKLATNLGVNRNAFITVNYGSGTSNLAASWVLFANITNHCGFKYWEIGNECYGTWETDNNTNNGFHAWDPYTYAVRAATYIAAMRAADPTIHIGCPVTPGDSAYANSTYPHPVTNLRTHATANGWTPVLLSTLASLGAKPDFLIHHIYPQYTAEPLSTGPPPPVCVDSDPFILQGTSNWAADAATLRQEISDYFGPPGTNIELCCTENNSDSSLGGKQLSSLVNGLYQADSLANLMTTEFNSYLWWDLRNGAGTGGELDASLYGWRQYGDEGMITGATGYNPVYYAMKIMQFFARPGDAILTASSDYLLLSAHASRQSNGNLSVLVVNKDPVASFNGQLNFTGFIPGSNAVARTYGESQDNATENGLGASLQDVATNLVNTASNSMAYTFPPYSLTVLTFSPAPAAVTNPVLYYQPLGGPNLVLTWTNAGLGKLLEAPNLNGPWSAVSGAGSPYTNLAPASAPQMFFKLQAQ